MNIAKGISLKLLSVVLFAVMSACIRSVGDGAAIGQIVFFRSFFAIIPVVLIYAWRKELGTAFRTGRPFGHLGRGFISIAGMFLSFAALTRLPLVDATAIGFASPLITVALAAFILKEQVRIYRWSAVAIGFVGVLIMLWPYLDPAHFISGSASTVGAICALAGALASSCAVVQTRRLTDSETTSSIVLYLCIFSSIAGAMTLPFVWQSITRADFLMLIVIGIVGGVSQLAVTESYRFAPASVVAPFDYTAMIFAFLIGLFFFGELPTIYIFIGAAIVTASGLFVIWRERRLGLKRKNADVANVLAGPTSGK